MTAARCRMACVAVALGVMAPSDFAATAAGKFQKLSGPQIRGKVAGRELSDGVHQRDLFGAGGALTSTAMGRKTTGKWRIQKDELCLERPGSEPACYEFWLDGNRVELRVKGLELPLVEGVLRAPGKNN